MCSIFRLSFSVSFSFGLKYVTTFLSNISLDSSLFIALTLIQYLNTQCFFLSIHLSLSLLLVVKVNSRLIEPSSICIPYTQVIVIFHFRNSNWKKASRWPWNLILKRYLTPRMNSRQRYQILVWVRIPPFALNRLTRQYFYSYSFRIFIDADSVSCAQNYQTSFSQNLRWLKLVSTPVLSWNWQSPIFCLDCYSYRWFSFSMHYSDS